MSSQFEQHVLEQLKELAVQLAHNNVLLAQHIRRTEMLEERIEPIETTHKTGKLLLRIAAWLLGGGGAALVGVKLWWGKLW